MPDLFPTVLALVAVVLMGIGLLEMTVGNLMLAGLTFLGASVVIYLRETRGEGGRSEPE